MEAVEYKKRQRETRDDAPRKESVERELQLLRHPVVCHERIEQPQRYVGKQKKSNNLPAGLKQHLIT